MNIYIGNLPKDMEEDELFEMFTEYGSVRTVKIIRDRHTRISRGYGFVEMDDEKAALEAINDWDQGSIDDNIINVKIAYSSQKKRAVMNQTPAS
jgi:RNA recognition motif-containing protein